MRSFMMGFWVALFACGALAGPNEARKVTEASMLVTGSIEVNPDGSVHGYAIDHPEKIPDMVNTLIANRVPGWRFQLDEPSEVIQRTRMYLRITASHVDDRHDSIAISEASFGDNGGESTDDVSFKDRQLIKYPRDAKEAGVSGTVYLLVRVNRQGTVENIAAEQVNLQIYTREAQMRYFRDVLADAAIKVAKNWTYNLPTTGPHMADQHWDVRVPVTFRLYQTRTPTDLYGKWEPYIPGPVQSISWDAGDAGNVASPDTIPEGGISQANASLHLATSPGGA
jgi:hypothetical protein